MKPLNTDNIRPKSFKKSKTKIIGNFGEKICASYLERRGHRIIHRNFRCWGGELDLITLYQGQFYCVEVKTLLVNILNEKGLSYFAPVSTVSFRDKGLRPFKLRRMRCAWDKFVEQNSNGKGKVPLPIHYFPIYTAFVVDMKRMCLMGDVGLERVYQNELDIVSDFKKGIIKVSVHSLADLALELAR